MRSADYQEKKSDLPLWQVKLISQILNSLEDYYCLPDKFDQKRESLKEDLVNQCKSINETLLKGVSENPPETPEQYKAFMNELNIPLHRFDPHLALDYPPPDFLANMEKDKKIIKSQHAAKFDFSDGPPKEEIAKWNQDEVDHPTTRNFGFLDYQGPPGVIPENIGYLNVSHLIDPEEGAKEKEKIYTRGPNAIEKLYEMMERLRHKDAIILDLSVTPYGGSPEMAERIVSFFVEKGTIINTSLDRLHDKEKIYQSVETPFKILDKPVAILIGSKTFSGREEIAYDLQQINTTLEKNRFTLIGQSTQGGAHPECAFPLIDMYSGDINQHLVLRVPYATSINPISKTNWEDGPQAEGKKPGVQPDIEILEEKAALEFAVYYLQKGIAQEASPPLATQSIFQEPKQKAGVETKVVDEKDENKPDFSG